MASLMSDLYLATTNAAPLELNAADLDSLDRGQGDGIENGASNKKSRRTRAKAKALVNESDLTAKVAIGDEEANGECAQS